MSIDRSNSSISNSWRFKHFQVPTTGESLKALHLPNDYELLVIDGVLTAV